MANESGGESKRQVGIDKEGNVMLQQKGRGWIWPDVSDENSSKDASKQGLWAAGFVATITSLMAFSGAMGFDQSAFVDAFLFVIIGFGIYRFSRTAAIAGLGLYIVERIYAWSTVGVKNAAIAAILILMFVNSIRGTFSYHKIMRQKQAT